MLYTFFIGLYSDTSPYDPFKAVNGQQENNADPLLFKFVGLPRSIRETHLPHHQR